MQAVTPRTSDTPREMIRAKQNEPMWVVVNRVKAERWEEHVRFIHDILTPASEKVDPVTYRHVRFLVPTKQNDDGTYTSIFLMDPLLPDAEYNILKILIQAYGEQKAQEEMGKWAETFAGEQSLYEMQQSPW